jgi:hypothetical protein
MRGTDGTSDARCALFTMKSVAPAAGRRRDGRHRQRQVPQQR